MVKNIAQNSKYMYVIRISPLKIRCIHSKQYNREMLLQQWSFLSRHIHHIEFST